MAEAGTLPFHLLAAQTTARIAIRIQANASNNNDLPLIRRVSQLVEALTETTLPSIAYITRRCEREWHATKPSILWEVKEKVRAGESQDIVRPIVQQLLSDRFQNSTVVYTDGSKTEGSVGAGLFTNGLTMSASLPEPCSVFSAEAYAIKMAVNIPNITRELVVMTDSASCLLALESGNSKHPWIYEVEQLTRQKQVHFCWIPGHAGVYGNTQADRLANEARSHEPINIPVPAHDAIRMVKNQIRQTWDSQWFTMREQKLREIKHDTKKWTDRDNARDQRVLTRLRIGHTRLTHTFLLKKENPPRCECCGTVQDVRHIILYCRKYYNERREYRISETSLRDALMNDSDAETNLIRFIKRTGLYKEN